MTVSETETGSLSEAAGRTRATAAPYGGLVARTGLSDADLNREIRKLVAAATYSDGNIRDAYSVLPEYPRVLVHQHVQAARAASNLSQTAFRAAVAREQE